MIGKKVAFDKLQPGDNEFRFPFTGDLKEAIGAIIRVNNINYDFNKSDIKPDAAIILDTMAMFLNDNPNITVELGSHSDTRGSSEYNRSLSQRRAQSCVDYLVQHGIAKDRLVPVGYGETKLVNDCADGVDCTEEQHQENRRTTFRVLSTEYKKKR